MNTSKKMEMIIENISSFEEGFERKMDKKETTKILSTLLFEFRNVFPFSRLIEVRDYEAIKEKGPFKYAGEIESMFEEGLLPKDVYELFKKAGLKNHVGPSYLRVKGLLTHKEIRKFFARQLAEEIKERIENNPPDKEGVILFIPNMTGGAWIGDETRRETEKILDDYEIWPSTPYMRQMRKVIEVKYKKDKLSNYVEGLIPSPEETSIVINFEELRTTSETTQNAIKILKRFGYNEENEIEIKAACVFDYRHPVGAERLRRLNVDEIYLVEGLSFFDASKKLGYIDKKQYETVKDWLKNPWDFTRKILSS